MNIRYLDIQIFRRRNTTSRQKYNNRTSKVYILPFGRKQINGWKYENKVKAIENRFEKQLLDTDKKSIGGLFAKDFLFEEDICDLNKFKKFFSIINIYTLQCKKIKDSVTK